MTVVKTITVSNGLVQSGASGTIDTADITASAVTYARVQNTAAGSVLLGRGAGLAGVVQEITLGSGLTMTGTVLSAAGGGTGTVTSFSAGNLSPLFTTSVATATTTPALSFALASQSANLVYAGPGSGAAAAPTFRALVPADYPVFVGSGGTHAAGAVPDPGATAGSTRYLREDASWQVPAGGAGTVTSVGLSTNVSWLTVGSSPVTGSGTITLNTITSGTPNLFWATQASGSGPWLQRAIVPADLPLFVAAGGSHAAGAVPDPGATAHTNQPFVLQDNVSWALPLGKILAFNYVATSQSTTSTSVTDLATVDSITFSLDATQNVIILYQAHAYNGTGGSTIVNRDWVMVDTVLDNNAVIDTGLLTAGMAQTVGILYRLSLASGSHTIKVQHGVPNGGTGTWYSRALMAILSP